MSNDRLVSSRLTRFQTRNGSVVDRKYNFSAGPAVLPFEVLEEARAALVSLDGTGIGVMEHSHRGKPFLRVYEEAVSLVREVAGIGDEFEVLFLQGGASLQFCMLPMNFLSAGQTADYLVTGSWAQKAIKEATRFGNAHTVCTSEAANFSYIPDEGERSYSTTPQYVHFTSNNTIFGTQFSSEPTVPGGAFLACDSSSDIFSRRIDFNKYGLVYAGAQKNLGPAGTTLVILRKELLERCAADLPTMLSYRTHAEKESMFNTPPTFGIYVLGRVLNWIKANGGLDAMAGRNQSKAGKLYEFLDASSLFSATARADSRSTMNVTFVTGDPEKDAQFVAAAEAAGFSGLKGHRSVGGMRASIYNAFPEEGVAALVDFMSDFEAKHG